MNARRRRSSAGHLRADLIRGPVIAAMERSTANSDAKGAISQGLSKLADALENGLWPVTEEALDRILGPRQPDPLCSLRR